MILEEFLDRFDDEDRRGFSAAFGVFSALFTVLLELFALTTIHSLRNLGQAVHEHTLSFVLLTAWGPIFLVMSAVVHPRRTRELIPPATGLIWRFDLNDLGVIVVLSVGGAWWAYTEGFSISIAVFILLTFAIGMEWLFWYFDGGFVDQHTGEYPFEVDDFD